MWELSLTLWQTGELRGVFPASAHSMLMQTSAGPDPPEERPIKSRSAATEGFHSKTSLVFCCHECCIHKCMVISYTKKECFICVQARRMQNSMYSSWVNELVICLHALALGKHSLFIIKPLADASKTSTSPPGLRGMLKAVATNWFPCLLFVMGTTQQSTPSINSSGIERWNNRAVVSCRAE